MSRLTAPIILFFCRTSEGRIPVHVLFLLVSDIISFFSRPSLDQDVDFLAAHRSGASRLRGQSTMSGLLRSCPSVSRRSPVVALVMWAAPLAVVGLSILKFTFWFAVSLLAPFPLLLFSAEPCCALLDPLIYIFRNHGAGEVLRALPCCQKPERRPESRATVATVAETVETRL